MKRLTIILSLVACGLLLATASAFMQSNSRKTLSADTKSQSGKRGPNEPPQTHLNNNRLHKLMIKERERAVYEQLARAGAIRNEIDYGSYRLVVVDEEPIGGRAALQAMAVAARDDQNMIFFNGYPIDTSNPRPLSNEPPADLKQSRMSQALVESTNPGKGLYIVQFAGPIKGEWLRALGKTGTEIISYVPNNAYIVLAGERAAGELMKLKKSYPFVQWMGDYQPAYKLAPGLRTIRRRGDSQPVRVTVQLIDNPEGTQKADQLRTSALRYLGERRVLKYRNLTIMIPASQLSELAKSDAVFAMEEDTDRVRLDEAQGQIVAGNLSGNAPSGPGNLAWLASKGFDSSQFGSFAVNVADDAYSLRGHPDLPDSRIAFENNPSLQTGAQGGHGFLNAHIIGGFNDGTGTAYEDANGFNYGLGIAPWARVGVTAIFGLSSASTDWEDAAYSQGARISSNSWGYRGLFFYSVAAQEYDHIVRDARSGIAGDQQLTVVFAAGNDGPNAGTVSSPATAKNVITVGASENVRPAGADGCGVDNSMADSADDIASFSSRGPVSMEFDGRFKPDIVAPGTHIQAGVPQSNYVADRESGLSVCDRYFPAGQTLYSWSSGTSHSTPAVAGGAALVYQDFINKGMGAPSPAMVKATLMNSASYLTGEGGNDTLPSNSQGMGLINLGRAFDGTPRLSIDQTRVFGSSGETYQITGSVASSNQPFRVTLAWTDAPGPAGSAPWVNDLDLEVTINGQTYLGNVFSGANSIAGGTADGKNNVESVFLPAGLSGNFTVTVRATNIAGDGLPDNDNPTDQDFALVIYNANSATPLIGVNPASLNFTAIAGGGNPAAQTLNIFNTGIGNLNWTASEEIPWLTLGPAGGAAPSSMVAAVDISGLPVGSHNGTITISSPDAPNSPVSVSVALTVLPILSVSPSSLSFISFNGSSSPAQLNISSTDGSPRSWTASSDVSWLTVSPPSGITPSILTVSANSGEMQEGTYEGTITITPADAPNLPVKVPVTMTVLLPFLVTPSSLTFGAAAGGDNPPNQFLRIFTLVQSPDFQDWTASGDVSWLTVSPNRGSAFSLATVSVDASGLSIGTYHGTITISATNSSSVPTRVPVTMVVDRLGNGGFEATPVPWILSGVAQRSSGAYPHSGTGYLTLGGAHNSSGYAYRQITIPHHSSPNLSFWLNVTSSETTPMARDRLFVEICDQSGDLLKTLAIFSNLNRSEPGSYTMAGSYNLARFAGQTVRIQFRTITDSSSITNFRIDDVKVQ